ncbi:GDP-fucose protein O-fucosyltransferase 1 isoform X1 [Octopus bimaculoides]|uniref:GDP-fucose protein O-fucosyltransferase 1 n=1 Tax=Octopus bimaculoides TaxID=37653 RepID=A0A0L8HQW9_OCTBM|nr:GDP-fucose protein O-fucosyltransferase 1 isoform X1 [Octopus bimaculoides]|eukprot:XP_014770257.1 PREDICTED: GDP-fucose protein O-fucosyltransferase 1-like isoform X1 [Octopus bimaculoides]
MAFYTILNVVTIVLLIIVGQCRSLDVDQSGYIVYCPCMGRFGNQAEQFLGSLAFAKRLNRTMVIPPWVEYKASVIGSECVAFDKYFQVEPLKRYHRVMTMEQFMKELAPEVWPPNKRIVFCYQARHSSKDSCNAKDGNPFGPFWDHFNVDFVQSEFHKPLTFDVSNHFERDRWLNRFPASKYPVLAFVGSPAPFPAREDTLHLHDYIKWSTYIEKAADNFIMETIPEKPFLGIHLRNGVDWKSACAHTSESRQMFASAQCIGYSQEYGSLSPEMCFPSDSTVINQVKKAVKKYKAKTVFVATDNRDLIKEMSKVMKQVKFVRSALDNPLLDLAILTKADHYIGNCISTFSAFGKRYRDSLKKSSSFWAFEKKTTKNEEL